MRSAVNMPKLVLGPYATIAATKSATDNHTSNHHGFGNPIDTVAGSMTQTLECRCTRMKRGAPFPRTLREQKVRDGLSWDSHTVQPNFAN